MIKEIKLPAFTLGWEFESITDCYGNGEDTGERAEPCGDCDDCNDGNSDDCTYMSREDSSVSHKCPVKEVDVIRDGSVNGASMEYVLNKSYVHSPDMGIHALWKLLKMTEVTTDKSCGFHVHIGLPERSVRHLVWAGWIQQLGVMIEDDVFNAVPESRRNNQYCMKLKNKKQPLSKTHFNSAKYSNSDRYYWINTVEMFRPGGIRTVEFRLLGNVSRFHYILSWIAFCRQMAISAYKLTYDVTLLESELNILRGMIQDVTTIHYPRIIEDKKFNRLAHAYDLIERTGLELRSNKQKPLEQLQYIEDRTWEDMKYETELEYKPGDIVRKTDGSMYGQVFIVKESYRRNRDEMLVINSNGDEYYAWRFELVDIAWLSDQTLAHNIREGVTR